MKRGTKVRWFLFVWERERQEVRLCLSLLHTSKYFFCFSCWGGESSWAPPPHPSPPTHTPVCNTVVLTLPGIAPPNETSVFVFILSSCVSENIQHGEKLYRKDRMRKREESWKRRNRKNTSLNFSDSLFFQSALKFKWAIPWKSKAQTGVEALWC